jgi:hypothetical protein
MGWTVETLNETVDAEVEALPEDLRARLAWIAELIEERGWSVCASRTLSTLKAVFGKCG